MSASISIILDTRRIKKTGKYPIKLRVTFDRVTEYYQTVFDLTKPDYEKLSASHLNPALQVIRDKLKEIVRAAEKLTKELEPFTFNEFEKECVFNNNLFRKRKLKTQIVTESNDSFDFSIYIKKFPLLLEKHTEQGKIATAYLNYVRKLLKEGRVATAVSYHASHASIKKFRDNLGFAEITPAFLHQFENSLRNRDISKTTIGMYLRPLRTLFNEAIEDGIIKREKCYPFGRRKYLIPASKNTKKSLDLNDVKKIYYYQCDPGNPSEQKAKDFWLFSYFGNGMNPKDIAFLKYKNTQDDYIVFERSKTERALRSDPKPITVFINDDMQAIISRWGNKDKSPNNYIFPIMEIGLTPLRQYEVMQLFVTFINDWMKRILKNLEINKKCTTYVARHTFSTILKRSGASTEYIREALGHSDIKTTESYLDSFDKEVKKEFAQRLTSFKHQENETLPEL